jgi:inhibitor of cysteine peptidase
MPTTITLTECNDGARVAARVGDTIEIRLPENASTGFRWTLAEDDSGVFGPCEQGGEYPRRTTGSGGAAIFRLTVCAPGRETLRLKIWRHWEGESSVRQRFTVSVEAGAG